MKPITPVLPHSDYPEVVYAKNQPEYLPLPAVNVTYSGGKKTVISCWRLDVLERLKLVFTGRIWLEQVTLGNPLQAQRPTVNEPLKS